MIEIKRASELGEMARKKISEVFVDAFGKELQFFTKDKKILADAIEHMFVLDAFYVAVVDGEIAGITTCTNGPVLCIDHNKKELRKHLGFYKGTIASMVFKREFQKPSLETGEDIASVGFVATSGKYRRKGVATAIMNHLFALPQYREYVLEGVADTNTSALKLYEKLGFKEFKRIKQKHTKISGINYYVYMKYVSNDSERTT
ncbi:GNAT family N-acetyltransferase [Paenibacillus hemerocallicola]|uniref:GNAT family N-acetyltransferase n=1 Tax=Paenibacillus hemerocallicola TaxID=1172614 RepID=UPI001FE3F730|nr:GNAT family N-acetyltransferase [Paenibacillus hemerocallicola]